MHTQISFWQNECRDQTCPVGDGSYASVYPITETSSTQNSVVGEDTADDNELKLLWFIVITGALFLLALLSWCVFCLCCGVSRVKWRVVIRFHWLRCLLVALSLALQVFGGTFLMFESVFGVVRLDHSRLFENINFNCFGGWVSDGTISSLTPGSISSDTPSRSLSAQRRPPPTHPPPTQGSIKRRNPKRAESERYSVKSPPNTKDGSGAGLAVLSPQRYERSATATSPIPDGSSPSCRSPGPCSPTTPQPGPRPKHSGRKRTPPPTLSTSPGGGARDMPEEPPSPGEADWRHKFGLGPLK